MAGRRTAAKAKRMETRPARDAAPEPATASHTSKRPLNPVGRNDVRTATERSCIEKGGKASEPPREHSVKTRRPPRMAAKDVGARTVTRGSNNQPR